MEKWKNETESEKEWNQISTQAAIVEPLASENNSQWRGRQCRHQQ
jgi:hypothetical protein